MIQKCVDLVIPAYNEEGNIEKIYASLTKIIPSKYRKKYIFIDDGSTDDTLKIIKKLNKKDKNVKFISFTRNFGHQYALKAGIDLSLGDVLITLDADGQHPPYLVPKMLKLWEKGNKIVYAKRVATENSGALKDLTSNWFYTVINSMSDTKLINGASDFRLLDREVADFIKNNPESNLFLRGLLAWSGYERVSIDYHPRSRYWGKTKYTYGKMVKLAIDAITSFSIIPLRLATILGLVMSFLSGVYGIYAVVVWTLHLPSVMIGWPSVIISVLFIGGLQLSILGIIGEYIGKIFVETKRRPLYLVKETNLS